jgi:hypothetical protein
MRLAEINPFGVYVAPISVMMVVAWFVTGALRRVAGCYGLLRRTRIILVLVALATIAIAVLARPGDVEHLSSFIV